VASEVAPGAAGEVEAALARCLTILSKAPAGLMTDIDGTISQIAPTPDQAVVPEAARAALTRLAHRLALVGVVTGRSAAAGAALVDLPGLTYVGNHGLERLNGQSAWYHPLALAGSDAIREALVAVGEAARSAGIAEGVIFEDKRLSGSIHYRLAAEPDVARTVLWQAATAAAEAYGLRVTEGRLLIELRPMLAVNKGTAIVDLIEEHQLSGIVFLGDDVTDADAFVRLRALRGESEVATLTVGVVGTETPPIVLENSDVTVPGVPACIELLGAIADVVESSGGQRA
jgi:trehalose 6-phosphate phosphatase